MHASRLSRTARAAFALSFTLATVAHAQSPHSALQARLQIKLDSIHSVGRFPGATFAVALPDGALIAIATGMSDTAAKLRMKPTDLMPSGSTGKTYVSALALQLVKEGKLDLAAPISKYLGSEPWFSRLPNSADITVRQLMNHTSGLVRYEFNEKFTSDLSKAAADKVWNPRDLIAYIFDTQAPFKAGEGWDYSDTNYMVLGIIIEKITGAKMIDEIQRRFVVPNKLTQTVPNAAPRVPGIVQGYAGANNPFGGTDAMLTNGAFAFNPAFEWAGGGWSNTTSDLVRWGKLMYEWKVIDQSLSQQFLDGAASRMLGQGTKYGLGVILWPAPPAAPSLGAAIGHSGFFPGYQTDMRYFTDHKFAAAFQVNTSVGRAVPRGPGGALIELAAIVVEELAKR